MNTQIIPKKSNDLFVEGKIKEYKYLYHSRNKNVRELCLKNSNGICYVCGFNFGKVYGEIGEGFLEVHHINPIWSFIGEHKITLDELYAVCSNCHSMIHRQKKPLNVEELKRIISERKI